MNKLLQIKGLSKGFPGVKALKNVDFDVEYGEVIGLLGENGAGKSTLIKILAGVYKKDAGQIKFDGKEIEIKSPLHSQSIGISVIFQELNLLHNLSITENLFIGREKRNLNYFMDFNLSHNEALKLLKQVGLNCDPKTLVAELSISQRQMVEVAKALSFNAKLIIMDEPTSSLTEQEIQVLFKIIEQLKNNNVSIIFVSHKMDEVFRICDRIHVLRDGENIGCVDKEQIVEDEVIKMMVGRDFKSLFQKQPADITDQVLKVDDLSAINGIRNISFELRKGEILGFAGLVGSGRTEVMRTIFGLDKITKGQIYVEGKPVNIESPRDAIRLGIGFVTEDRKDQGLVLELSVRENISMASLIELKKSGLIQKNKEVILIDKFIKALRIKTPHREQKVLNLSGGNQQKVVLSKWLLTNPKILILDEPTRGIDIGAKREIYDLMTELANQGVGIIMISSELTEILAMSDRIIVMHEGVKKGELSVDEASQERIMGIALKK